ncbi:3-oxoacyl-[acyl-carrier-protein] synthase-3 [Roseivirga pacifica]|jgi:3-oxoacyl-[acyl-carrier-protein] synthase III|uniref:Beta-ketoacyl-[acyl-carrier-protein] synthase III n=1 Tax=Roseivirga pacifica TaxID=1267423 RepID=A0A1I0QUR8_9BACT|nr:beta-ketoacyl-ACP synthase III [Roseivirga pacifica]MCO6357218.1 beta-ketoacyl-ACP synthase III [Roseivirga pacifica]MCO6368068.1 beta-ketoacyl-ACP synthase III [Roseivirga pacifica]MCO6369450.1 beta-ketoacyl-ACP synthase III [Roseivirga pacifica]MCO6373304.1 beta-ketoacyl-ACP synthase III [Roseivirga pacifica]MCO6377439.1 beta-ketoacyl-ACP synthase III [Roseivirga pacifica]
MKNSKIIGIGHYVPEKVVTNHDLEKIMDTSDEWIVERTGINERRWFNPEKDTVSNMAKRATDMAVQRAGIEVSEIDFIVFATITPDYFFPGSGVLLQRELGLQGIGALDIRNACSGFIYGLSVADQFIKSGMYKTILVVGAEIQSSALDKSTEGRSSSVIFADGAGAAILRATDEQKGILSTHLHADGDFAEELYVKDPGSSRKVRLSKELLDGKSFNLTMNGNTVFKHAVVRFSEVIKEALEHNQMGVSDIDLLIPHQANLRISNFVQGQFKLPDDKVFNNIMYYGNTTAASIPIAMSEAYEKGLIKEDMVLCLAAFGSGFTWASALIKW